MHRPLDQREGCIRLDGRLVDWPDARLHVLSHGLHYASSVFEGERIYRGEIFAPPVTPTSSAAESRVRGRAPPRAPRSEEDQSLASIF